jgi:hypothetical protein
MGGRKKRDRVSRLVMIESATFGDMPPQLGEVDQNSVAIERRGPPICSILVTTNRIPRPMRG